MFVYRIQRVDGKFSTGGHSPSWSAKGKLWKRIGDLKSHLTLLGHRAQTVYADATVVEYEVQESQSNRIPASSLLTAMETKALEREQRLLAARDTYQREQRRHQYEALRCEFEMVTQKDDTTNAR